MPVGNGDLAANVWTEQNGDLVVLVAKADSWAESGNLVKLGRVRINLAPNPFVGVADFAQKLKLEKGLIEISSGANVLRIWVDANHPVIHVETHLEHPGTMQASLELWRRTDTLFPAGADRITWCHFNSSSTYPSLLQQEHLESLAQKYPDPLLHRCFGATLTGPGLVGSNDHTLNSLAPGRDFRLDLIALTQRGAWHLSDAWRSSLDSLAAEVNRVGLAPGAPGA